MKKNEERALKYQSIEFETLRYYFSFRKIDRQNRLSEMFSIRFIKEKGKPKSGFFMVTVHLTYV